jgi:hypothetical protein
MNQQNQNRHHVGCSASSGLEFYKYLEYKYERMVGGLGCGGSAVVDRCTNNAEDTATTAKDMFTNNVALEDIGPEDTVSDDSEKVKTDSKEDEDITKVRNERDEAFEKILKLENMISDMKRDPAFQSKQANRISEGLKQEISVTLNGTNVRINIEIDDTKHDSSNYMDTKETQEESMGDVDDLLMIDNDEEADIELNEIDDSLLDVPDEPSEY